MRRLLLALSRDARVRDSAVRLATVQRTVARFVPGETIADAVGAARRLAASGLHSTIDHLGENVRDADAAEANTRAYLELIATLVEEGLTDVAEVSVKASAIGQALPEGRALALTNARRLCAAAQRAGTTVTLDMEDHTTTDATLDLLRGLRQEFDGTGGVLQAMLRRTATDCREFASPGSRIRLCKGAYAEPSAIAHSRPADISDAYLTCLRVLFRGGAYPMVATHDPELIAAALGYADLLQWRPGSFEFQMLYGIRPDEQRRLADLGHTVRVYVPYGTDWYPYFMRRLAEKPANLALLARALLSPPKPTN